MKKPPKRKCTAKTKSGRDCRAWATHDSNPALCSAHAGRNVGAGAPEGNQNALKHGFYRSALTADEVADLITHAESQTLDDELALVRVMLRRLLTYLNTSHHAQAQLSELIQAKAQVTTIEDVVTMMELWIGLKDNLVDVAPLIFRGARTAAYLIRQLGPGGSPRDWLDEALDELSDEFAIDL